MVVASFLLLPIQYTPSTFKVPCIPVLPCIGMLATLHLIGSLGWPAYVRWVVWFVIGTAIYVGYGMWQSAELGGDNDGDRWSPTPTGNGIDNGRAP